MANRQFNQTIQSDIRPLQSDIKFLVLIPINPTDLDQVRLPAFSVNQLKVLIGSSFFLWLVIKVRVHSENNDKQQVSAASERDGYLGRDRLLPPSERRRLLPVNISDTGNDFSSIYQGTN